MKPHLKSDLPCLHAGLMHWFTSPYVHWLTYNSTTGLAEVETLSFFAKHQRRTFSESEVEYAKTLKPQATFQVCLSHHVTTPQPVALAACSS